MIKLSYLFSLIIFSTSIYPYSNDPLKTPTPSFLSDEERVKKEEEEKNDKLAYIEQQKELQNAYKEIHDTLKKYKKFKNEWYWKRTNTDCLTIKKELENRINQAFNFKGMISEKTINNLLNAQDDLLEICPK